LVFLIEKAGKSDLDPDKAQASAMDVKILLLDVVTPQQSNISVTS